LVSDLSRNSIKRLADRVLQKLSPSSGLAKPLLGLLLTIVLCTGFTSAPMSMLFGPAPSHEGAADADNGRAGTLATTILDLEVSPSRAYVDDTITFYANASSDVSSSLTFVIYFDSMLGDYTNNTASPSFTTTTGNPGNVVTTFAYDHIGNLTLADGVTTYFVAKLYVSDGTNTRSASVAVYVVPNLAPVFTLNLPSGLDVSVGVEYNFSVSAEDVDDDPLTIIWDFGDGTTPVVNSTGPAAAGVSATQSHTWSPYLEPGCPYPYNITFTFNVTLEDGQGHATTSSTIVRIYVAESWPPAANLWSAVTYVDPADEVLIQANATDHEGDPLTWTFIFSNDTSVYNTTVYHTAPTEPETTVWLNITHVFGVVGNYSLTLWLTDALLPELQEFPHNVSSSLVFICAQNKMPEAMMNITVSPTLVWYNETTGSASAQLSILALDPDGDVITVTWDFGDGTSSEVNVSGGGRSTYTFMKSHNYSAAGIYYLACTISDGRDGHNLTRYGNVTIRSNNSAPTVRSMALELSNGNFAVPNSTLNFTLVFTDLERDPIEVWCYFGDNTTVAHAYIDEFDSDGNGSCTFSHIYTAAGTYMILVWYTDNEFDYEWHNNSVAAQAQVRAAWVQEVIVWDWWDTTSLALVFAGVGAVIAYGWYVSKFRTRLDQVGLTLEEHKILQKEQKAKLHEDRKAKGSKKNGPGNAPKQGGAN